MNTFLQTLIDGIATGSLYAMIALGYTLVYGIIRLINFAHGEFYMIGAYVGLFILGTPLAATSSPILFILLFMLALGASGGGAALLAVITERLAYQTHSALRTDRGIADGHWDFILSPKRRAARLHPQFALFRNSRHIGFGMGNLSQLVPRIQPPLRF